MIEVEQKIRSFGQLSGEGFFGHSINTFISALPHFLDDQMEAIYTVILLFQDFSQLHFLSYKLLLFLDQLIFIFLYDLFL